MKTDETLKEALTRVGDSEHLEHLNEAAGKLTKAQITDILNNKIDPSITVGTLSALRKLGKQRTMEGKSAFPFGKMEGVKHSKDDDNLSGGTW